MGFDCWFLAISAVLAIPYTRGAVMSSESFIFGWDIMAFERRPTCPIRKPRGRVGTGQGAANDAIRSPGWRAPGSWPAR